MADAKPSANAPSEIGATSVCAHAAEDGTVCGLPIELVESHSSEDCEIEGSMWWHDAESVPEPRDPCDAYDANDDHDGVPWRSHCSECGAPMDTSTTTHFHVVPDYSHVGWACHAQSHGQPCAHPFPGVSSGS